MNNRISNIETPDDILDITIKIDYDNDSPDSKYIVKLPKDVLKSGKGICYDIVELERKLFNYINYKFKTFFAYENLPITNSLTHTFLVFKENNKYFWFELSWESYKGIHGPFNSYRNSIRHIAKLLKYKLK